MSELTSHLNPGEAKTIALIAKFKLLPESYLFGAADVRTVGEYYHSFILGHIYQHGVWFYFPVVLTIKCTEALLALLLIAGFAIVVRALCALGGHVGSSSSMSSALVRPIAPYCCFVVQAIQRVK